MRCPQVLLEACHLVAEGDVRNETVLLRDRGLSVLETGEYVERIHILYVLDAKFDGCRHPPLLADCYTKCKPLRLFTNSNTIVAYRMWDD